MNESSEGRRAFISYARADRPRVGVLAQGLRRLHWQVWFDEALIGGQSWWDSILAEIRRSDVLVLALSKASLASEPVEQEVSYARALGVPVLPVVVGPVDAQPLPPELAGIQFVPFTEQSVDAVYALAAASAHVPARPPVTRPHPPQPPMPVSPVAGRQTNKALPAGPPPGAADSGWLAVKRSVESKRIVLDLRLTQSHRFEFATPSFLTPKARVNERSVSLRRASGDTWTFLLNDGEVSRAGLITADLALSGRIKNFSLRIDRAFLFRHLA